jgi:alpha-L-fucosidase 2
MSFLPLKPMPPTHLSPAFAVAPALTMLCGALAVASGAPAFGARDASGAEGMTLAAQSPIYRAAQPKALDLKDEVTLEAWVQADAMPPGGGRILDKSEPNTDNGYMLDTFPGNSLRLVTRNGHVNFSAQLPADKWTHVVGVYSSSRKIHRLYVNGQEVAAKTEGDFPPLSTSSVPLRVGADSNSQNRFLGRIGRAAVYGRALSAVEIAQRFAAGTKGQARGAQVLGDWIFAAQNASVLAPVAGAIALKARLPEPPVDFSGAAPAPREPLSLWYREPAREWVQALAIGNGRLGGMVFGRVGRERIALNEDTFWSGAPYDASNPEALGALPEVRRLIFAGEYKAAEVLADQKMRGNPPAQSSYQPIGDLALEFLSRAP